MAEEVSVPVAVDSIVQEEAVVPAAVEQAEAGSSRAEAGSSRAEAGNSRAEAGSIRAAVGSIINLKPTNNVILISF